MSRVIVLGAGVIGLSCAVRALEAGHEVSVLARDLPLETTSAVAAALWYPYRAHPPERVTAWAATTYAELSRLAATENTGIVLREGTEVLRARAARPWWASAVSALHETTAVPAPYVGGWTFASPVVEMPLYLAWLAERIEALGGTITRMALSGLPDQAQVVVNATGLGARLFGPDPSVMPVRGQVVYVEQVGLEQWCLDSGTSDASMHPSTYVVPRSKDIVLGGTDDEGEWGRTPDDAVTKDIVARARELVPQLRRAKVLGTRVGLRPARPTVRLDATNRESGERLIHCYGHGGAGVTLSWGCADEVVALIDD